ncbi:type II toxin-antitoxin system HipA family toxin [Roseivirga sp. BDSF3-8]|uniref:type II toxin-antitoxin system HipA family toxin n=1 Tax=Roseivirga sp. BDSF3-8 TaxID=3241598 RepID=UPI0035320A2C
MITIATVKIWGRDAGAIAWQPDRGLATFEYAPSFVQTGWDLSPLKMPLKDGRRIYEFPELRKKPNDPYNTFKGLPGLLADVLPDRYGNQLINAWLARNGRPEDSMNPVETLCFIGQRGMGALEFEPAQFKAGTNTFSVEIDQLVDIARQMLEYREGFATELDDNHDEQAIREMLKIGTSAGGARPKAVIAYNEKSGEVRSGQTRVPKGFEHWLIKLDGVSDVQLGATQGYGRVEMAYYLMAKHCGIDIMPSTLLEENGRAHFMTKRFDREGADTKHHMQTFCAMKHFDYNEVTSYSYEQLFQTMRELKLTYPEAEQMYRRMVFNVLSRNCDDHTKNFAFLMKKDTARWTLAPAYDICHAYRPGSQWVSQHALSVNGKRQHITKADFLTVAEAMNIRKPEHIIQEVNDTVNQWEHFADEVEVLPDLKKAIKKTLVSV